jgi:1-aminocyclopropane-1-carboxylate deaminase/D-cysteine desulfhydrase-like pyridoxal-dependent ACC family enzyme
MRKAVAEMQKQAGRQQPRQSSVVLAEGGVATTAGMSG